MGLLQRACETYDANQQWAGVYREGHEVLPPIGHILTAADIEITLDIDGHFIQAAAVAKNAPKTLIPVTEESMGRASTAIRPHPLCDELSYISPQDSEKNNMYLEVLGKWRESHYGHPILDAVYHYVQGGTIIRDLENAGLLKQKSKKQKIKESRENDKEKEEGEEASDNKDLFIRWRVDGIPNEDGACWQNHSLHLQFIRYTETLNAEKSYDLCMISGTESISATMHAKGIVPLYGNAKLISLDKSSKKNVLTFKGRFKTDVEAMCVSYTASQKAHNALRWLIGEQSCYAVPLRKSHGEGSQDDFTIEAHNGSKAFLCWNPHGLPVPAVTDPFGDLVEQDPIEDIDYYRDRLKKTLAGYKTSLPENEPVVIAVFDAATTGRLSLNYYSEIASSDFLNRLYDWDEHCCWWFMRNKGIRSPRLLDIVCSAFGTQRTEWKKGKEIITLDMDDRVKAQQMLRLVACRINRSPMPTEIKEALVHRASSPMAYKPSTRRMILSTACAVIKKYDHDRKGVNWEMALKPDKPDLSYQYGRLLAVMEKAERDTYDKDSNQEPNAIRMQSMFVQRPQYAAARIIEQLNQAYFPKLMKLKRSRCFFYQRLIGDIYAMIDTFPEEQQNRPLLDSYLMGYYLQMNELRKFNANNNEQNTEEETENDFAE